MSNPFVPSVDDYQRRITPISDYAKQSAQYLFITEGEKLGMTFEDCLAFVKRSISSKPITAIKYPDVYFMQRDTQTGDREPVKTDLRSYISDSVRQKDIIAPTLTTYVPATIIPSLVSAYQDDGITKRNVSKKAMFKAEAAGDKLLAMFKNNDQRNYKLNNNAISGAHVSNGTPLSNPSGHSTLTSTCRCTSGYGNANNEKMFMGNRHYWKADIVMWNITAIVTETDYPVLQALMDKYSMHVPTTDEVMDCITYSTELYWLDSVKMKEIREYVNALSGIQKAAFLYTGDLYHIKKHNDQLVRDFVGSFITEKPPVVLADEEAQIAFIHSFPGDDVPLAMQVTNEFTGMDQDLKKVALVDNGLLKLQKLGSALQGISDAYGKYDDFIKVLFTSKNSPASLSYFPRSIRRAALTSDTDSTIFTADPWVMWYCGSLDYTREAVKVAEFVFYIAAQAIIHILAMMSANLGVEKKNLHRIAMKNEYFFLDFVPTQVSKHYYATKARQEGVIFKEFKREIKGVHLKNSNTPEALNKKALEMMIDIMDTRRAKGKLSIRKYLRQVAKIEHDIFTSIKAGEPKYFRRAQIKSANSYNSTPERSNYFHKMLWDEVFAAKYPVSTEPPYSALRVSLNINNKTQWNQWLADIEDRVLADNLKACAERCGKQMLKSIMIPAEAVRQYGLVPEIAQVVNIRSIVVNLCSTFYLILSSIGFHRLSAGGRLIVSDYIGNNEAIKLLGVQTVLDQPAITLDDEGTVVTPEDESEGITIDAMEDPFDDLFDED